MMIILNKTGPELCPNCHNVENKIEVCRNCKYEYKEEYTYPYWYISLGIDIGLFFAMFWMFNSLVEIEFWWSFPLGILSALIIIMAGFIVWPLFSRIK